MFGEVGRDAGKGKGDLVGAGWDGTQAEIGYGIDGDKRERRPASFTPCRVAMKRHWQPCRASTEHGAPRRAEAQGARMRAGD